MKQRISNLQIIFLTANFIFSSAVISLPQIIVQIGGQNAWLVPILLFPILYLIILVIFGKKRNHERLNNLFIIGKNFRASEIGFIIFFALVVVVAFLHDLRALMDFVATVLLPATPINMVMVLSILTISYITLAGLEVISRINSIHVGLLLFIILMLPFLLINEIDLGNLKPLPSLHTISSLLQTSYLSFSWMGEMLFIIIIIANVNPVHEARNAVISGTAVGLFLFFLILFLEITVLGTKIVGESVYPTYILIQQINLSDFLDRLDLIIVAFWLPAFIAKLAYLLYALNHCFSFIYKSNTNKFLIPIAFILGFLSILLFKNNLDHLNFSFYTWSSLGLLLEGIIVLFFVFVKRVCRKEGAADSS